MLEQFQQHNLSTSQDTPVEYPVAFLMFSSMSAILAKAESWHEVKLYSELYFQELKSTYQSLFQQEIEADTPPDAESLYRSWTLLAPTELENNREALLTTLFNAQLAQAILAAPAVRGVKKPQFDHQEFADEPEAPTCARNIEILQKLTLAIYNHYRVVHKCRLADAKYYFLKASPVVIYESLK